LVSILSAFFVLSSTDEGGKIGAAKHQPGPESIHLSFDSLSIWYIKYLISCMTELKIPHYAGVNKYPKGQSFFRVVTEI
jgi:hypothetical protein